MMILGTVNTLTVMISKSLGEFIKDESSIASRTPLPLERQSLR